MASFLRPLQILRILHKKRIELTSNKMLFDSWQPPLICVKKRKVESNCQACLWRTAGTVEGAVKAAEELC